MITVQVKEYTKGEALIYEKQVMLFGLCVYKRIEQADKQHSEKTIWFSAFPDQLQYVDDEDE